MRLWMYAEKLKGLQTVESAIKRLGKTRGMTIKKMHELRKAGYLLTTRGARGKRLYRISTVKEAIVGNPGLYDIVNAYAARGLQVIPPKKHRIHGRELSVEEALVEAIRRKDLRLILAALALFNHIKNWKKLSHFAKKASVESEMGALYEVAKHACKVRRMDKRTLRMLLKHRKKHKKIVDSLKSKDFTVIQKKWNVDIPFNREDLREYEYD